MSEHVHFGGGDPAKGESTILCGECLQRNVRLAALEESNRTLQAANDLLDDEVGKIAALEADLARMTGELQTATLEAGELRIIMKMDENHYRSIKRLVTQRDALTRQLQAERERGELMRGALEFIADWKPEPTLAYQEGIRGKAQAALPAVEGQP